MSHNFAHIADQYLQKLLQKDRYGAEIIINLDPEEISQESSNLLTNAIKYSNKNTSISLKITELDDDVLISVKYEGLGISKEYQDVRKVQVWDIYTQTDCGVA